jgi:deoxyribonuclease V
VQYAAVASWPVSADELVAAQLALAAAAPSPWTPRGDPLAAGCFVCSSRHKSGVGVRGDPAWAGAALVRAGRAAATVVVEGEAGAPYEPGLLALREGPLLERAVRALPERPDVVLADATGRDHPRRAGLALHLGAVLEVPTVGVTHRPLLATGDWPPDEQGARSPLLFEGELVGYWLRTRAGTRPLAVHAAFRTTPETAVAVVLGCTGGTRTPDPLRAARTLARTARARNSRERR